MHKLTMLLLVAVCTLGVGCGGFVAGPQADGTIELTNPTVTRNADSTVTLTDGNTVVHAPELTGGTTVVHTPELVSEDDSVSAAGWCCATCDINGNCRDCHSCQQQN